MLEGSKKNFQKVLDDTAKADQNLASLLLTTKARKRIDEGGKEIEVVEYRENKFSKILDDDEKSRLESRFCADNDKT